MKFLVDFNYDLAGAEWIAKGEMREKQEPRGITMFRVSDLPGLSAQ